jgi:hypothetical protein
MSYCNGLIEDCEKIIVKKVVERPNGNFVENQHHNISIQIFIPVRHSTAISYPSIENLFNGCQGHPLVCLPPGTAQRQPDRIKKRFERAAVYSANSCR